MSSHPPSFLEQFDSIVGPRPQAPSTGGFLREMDNILGTDTTGPQYSARTAEQMGYPPTAAVSALLQQQTPMQATDPGFFTKAGRVAKRVGQGLVESVNVFEDDISGRERLARGLTAASFFVPFGVTAKLVGAGAKLGARVAATAAQEAAIGGAIAAVRGDAVLPSAGLSAGIGGGLEALITRGRTRGARRAHRAATQAFETADPQRFTNLRDTPLRSEQYAIVSPQSRSADAALNAQRTKAFAEELQRRGYDPIPLEGFSPLRKGESTAMRVKEDSFLVPGMSDREAIELAIRFNQESVITRRGLFNVTDGTLRDLDMWGMKFSGAVDEADDFFSAIQLTDPKLRDFQQSMAARGSLDAAEATGQRKMLFSLRFADEATPLRAGPLTQPMAARYVHADNPNVWVAIARNIKGVKSGIMEKIDAAGRLMTDIDPQGREVRGMIEQVPGWRTAFQADDEIIPVLEHATRETTEALQSQIAELTRIRTLPGGDDVIWEELQDSLFHLAHLAPPGTSVRQAIDSAITQITEQLDNIAAGAGREMSQEVGAWKVIFGMGEDVANRSTSPTPTGHLQFRSYEEAVAYVRDRGYQLDEVIRPKRGADPVLDTDTAITAMIEGEPGWLTRVKTRMTNAPWKQKLHARYQGLLDQWHGFDLLDMAATGKPWRQLDTLPVDASVRATAQLMGGFGSIAEHNLKSGLVPITRNAGQGIRPGLYQIVQKHLTEHEFDSFINYGFARRWLAIEKTGKKLPKRGGALERFTTDELQDLVDTAPQHFAKAFDEIVDWRNTLLKEYLGKTGVLSRKALRAILTSEDYVPLRRALDEIIERVNVDAPANFFGVFNPLHKLRGAPEKMQNWFEVLEKETVLFTQLGMQQMTLNQLVGSLRSLDPSMVNRFAKRVKRPGLKLSRLKREMIAQMRESDPALADAVQHLDEEILSLIAPNVMLQGRPVVGALVRGKRQHWEITDQQLWDSVKSMGPTELSWFERLIANPASRGAAGLFRAGTVLGLEFMARNPIRDVIWAAATAGANPLNFLRGFASALRGDEWFTRWQASGGPRAALVSMDRGILRREFGNAMKGRGAALTGVIRHPLDALRAASELMESGTRLGHYRSRFERYMGEGMDPMAASQKAALDSRNVSVDFAVHGTQLTALRLATAFWNPMLQGWRELVTKTARDPVGIGIRGTIAVTLPSIGFYLANTRGDPETAQEYRDLPQWEKMLFWHFKTESGWKRIPKPFELGMAFGTLPEKMMEAIDAEDPTILDAGFAEMSKDVAKGFVPVPTLIRPFAERLANYDFFRERQLIPRGDEELEPRFRETAGTSEMAKQMVRFLRLDELGVDPITVDHFLRSYTGGLGMMSTDIADMVYRAATDAPEPPGSRRVGPFAVPSSSSDFPGLRAFSSSFPENNEATEKFYRFAERVRSASRTANTLERELQLDDLEDYMTQRAALLGVSSEVNAVMTQLTELRHQRTQIRNDPNLDGVTKQELIDQIIDSEYQLALAATELEGFVDEAQMAIDEEGF